MKSKSLWLRSASQRLGGAVIYQSKGQTIGRELAAKVTNPRSQAQMAQRVRLANLVNLYRLFRPWMYRGAFENKPQTYSDYNAFVAANIGVNAAYLSKAQAAAGASVIAPVMISRGSLTPIVTSFSEDYEVISNIKIGAEDTNISDFGQLSRMIIANNPGILDGDQISLVVVEQGTQNNVPYCTCKYFEMTLDVASTDTNIPTWISVATLAGVGMFLQYSSSLLVGGAAFILSRKVNGTLKVSTQSLVLTTQAQTYFAQFANDIALNTSVASYGSEAVNFLDPNTTGASGANSTSGNSIVAARYDNTSWIGPGFTAFDVADGRPLDVQMSNPINATELSEVTATLRNQNNAIIINGSCTGISNGLIEFDLDGLTAGLEGTQKLCYAIEVNYYGATWRIESGSPQGGQADPGDVTP